MPALFDPIRLGDLDLPNRVIMAPLTRMRADPDDAGADGADGGTVCPAGVRRTDPRRGDLGGGHGRRLSGHPGHLDAPSRSTGWKRVTAAVHAPAAASPCSSGMWDGSPSRAYWTGATPVSASAIAAAGFVSHLRPKRPFPVAARAGDSTKSRHRRGVPSRARRTPRRPASTASRSTAPTATCSTSSCRTAPTSAPTPTAARSRTAPACIWRWPTPASRSGAPTGSACTWPRAATPTTWATATAPAPSPIWRANWATRKLAYLFLREHVAPDRLAPAIKAAFGGPVIGNEQYTPGAVARRPRGRHRRRRRLRPRRSSPTRTCPPG